MNAMNPVALQPCRAADIAVANAIGKPAVLIRMVGDGRSWGAARRQAVNLLRQARKEGLRIEKGGHRVRRTYRMFRHSSSPYAPWAEIIVPRC